MSNQRPRITFDEHGVCSACNFAEEKNKKIDWDLREKELQDLCNKHRRKDGYWDVVVPCSGGKDSTFVAHMLKYKYNMNPLTVTWTPMLYTDVGWRNLQHMIASGIDNILGSPDGKTHRILTKLSIELLESWKILSNPFFLRYPDIQRTSMGALRKSLLFDPLPP